MLLMNLSEKNLPWQLGSREKHFCDGCKTSFYTASALGNHVCSRFEAFPSGSGVARTATAVRVGAASGSARVRGARRPRGVGRRPASRRVAVLSSRPAVVGRASTSSLVVPSTESLPSTSKDFRQKTSSKSVECVHSVKLSSAKELEHLLKENPFASSVNVKPSFSKGLPYLKVETKRKSISTGDPDPVSQKRFKSEVVEDDYLLPSESIVVSSAKSEELPKTFISESSAVYQIVVTGSSEGFLPVTSFSTVSSQVVSPAAQHAIVSEVVEDPSEVRHSSEARHSSEVVIRHSVLEPSTSNPEDTLKLESEQIRLCSLCGEREPHTCSIRLFECTDCKKGFSSRFKLSRHQLIHGGERQYSCTICDRSFHRKDHLKNHLQIHEPTKQYKCDRSDCGKEYNSYMSYRRHCAFHSAEEGDLQCKFCFKMFEDKTELIYHLKVHASTRAAKSPSEKKFQCEQCDRRFFTRKDVKRHMVVHTGTRDFCCSLCPQKFGRKDHLVRHIKKSHGVTDVGRIETLTDPLAVAGPSGVRTTQHPPLISPLSPDLSSSSGDTGGFSFMPSSPSSPHFLTQSSSPHMMQADSPHDPTLVGHPLPPYQVVGGPNFSGFASLLDPEPVKEEPELMASMTTDISNFLGLYLPVSCSMGSFMEVPVVSSQFPDERMEESPLHPPPPYPGISSLRYEQLVDALPADQDTTQQPSPLPHLLPLVPRRLDELAVPTTTSSSSTSPAEEPSTSTQQLPKFDQAFP